MEKNQEQVAKRAYELFQARGGQDGYHIVDWLQAEKEMGEKGSGVKPKATTTKATAVKTSTGAKKRVVKKK